MAKKILVIDFTYIMYNVIKVYKDRVNVNENSTITWRILEEEFGLTTNIVKYDARAYKDIFRKICKLVSSSYFKFTFTMDMDIVAKELAHTKDTYNITNIDYFSDIDTLPKASNKVNNLNWVRYLYNRDKVESYKWINTCTSILTEEIENMTTTRELSIDEYEDFDELIVTYSPQFVPYEYKTLFDSLAILVNECISEDNKIYSEIREDSEE